MALVKKLSTDAATKTHGEVDGSIIDLINPTVPLADTTSNFLRAATFGLVGWVGRGYRDTQSFSL